jgi:chromate reductase
MRKVLGALGARVIDRELPVGNADEAFEGDRLADRDLELELANIVAELVGEAKPLQAAAA